MDDGFYPVSWDDARSAIFSMTGMRPLDGARPPVPTVTAGTDSLLGYLDWLCQNSTKEDA